MENPNEMLDYSLVKMEDGNMTGIMILWKRTFESLRSRRNNSGSIYGVARRSGGGQCAQDGPEGV